MAAVFTVVAVSIVAADLLQAGMALPEALWQPLAQRPVLFFVGFMLTEPLTLPPRRWQQLALAAVVGVLFAVPYNLGFVANSPELALLVGNAARLRRRTARRGPAARSSRSRPLTPTTTEFSFRPERPVRFTPGQYLELHLPPDRPRTRRRQAAGKGDGKGIRRVFSLTSAPGPALLTIGVGTAEPLSIGQALAAGPGSPATSSRATTVGGDFVLPRTPATPVLLIAAGIGITPYLAQLAGRRRRQTATSSCCTWPRTPRNSPMPRSCSAPGRGSWPGLPTVRRRRPSWRTRGPGRIDGGGPEGAGPGHRRPGGLRLRLARQCAFAAGRGAQARAPAGSMWIRSPATERQRVPCCDRRRRACVSGAPIFRWRPPSC